jgi:spermidine/putrescine-binding protein
MCAKSKAFWVGVDSADVLQGLAFATGWGFALPELKKRGETWKMADLQEGTTGWVDNWMLAAALEKNPELKRIAEEWINFSLSPEVQVGYVRNIAQFPVNMTITERLAPEEAAYFHVGDPQYFKEKFILWEVLNQRAQNGFKYMWEQAKGK